MMPEGTKHLPRTDWNGEIMPGIIPGSPKALVPQKRPRLRAITGARAFRQECALRSKRYLSASLDADLEARRARRMASDMAQAVINCQHSADDHALDVVQSAVMA